MITITMKTVGCDLYTQTDKVETLKWCPSDQVRIEINKLCDATEEDDASSNIPRKVYTKAKLRHK